MKLNSELDVLLATARELLQAEDDAKQQTLQLHAALMRTREGLQRNRLLAKATAERLRVLAGRLHLVPPEVLAKAQALSAIAALLAPAPVDASPRVAHVLPFRPYGPFAHENPEAALQRVLRELLADSRPTQVQVLTRVFGLDLTPGAPLAGSRPLGGPALAKELGVSATSICDDFFLVTNRLREPQRAARLRPFYDALRSKRRPSRGAAFLRFIFEPDP